MKETKEKTKSSEHTKAVQFFNSTRGFSIIGQALHIAIEAMEKVPMPYKEVSNINDMKYLEEELFPMFKGLKDFEKTQIKRGRSKK